jgi:hypothetical protein
MADPALTKPRPVRAQARKVRSVAKMSSAMDPVLSTVESSQNARRRWGRSLAGRRRRREERSMAVVGVQIDPMYNNDSPCPKTILTRVQKNTRNLVHFLCSISGT